MMCTAHRMGSSMPAGDGERAFAAATAADGIELVRARAPWLDQRGGISVSPSEAGHARTVMALIFGALDGRLTEQAARRLTPLPGDFVHPGTGTFIEIDESQHFTSFRLLTLDHYPDDIPLGFDRNPYRRWAPTSDKYRVSKAAVGFGDGGRQRQHAYHDALRDLATPAMAGSR